MTPKNVGVSEELLAAMDSAAKAQGKTADELFEVAARRLLEHNGLDALAKRGEAHAQRLGQSHPTPCVSPAKSVTNRSAIGDPRHAG
jgi:hypothetical protein